MNTDGPRRSFWLSAGTIVITLAASGLLGAHSGEREIGQTVAEQNSNVPPQRTGTSAPAASPPPTSRPIR